MSEERISLYDACQIYIKSIKELKTTTNNQLSDTFLRFMLQEILHTKNEKEGKLIASTLISIFLEHKPRNVEDLQSRINNIIKAEQNLR